MTLNEAKYAFLADATGQTGTLNELEILWLGGTGTLNERWHQYLDGLAIPPGPLGQRQYEWLLGETGAAPPKTLNELFYLYWTGGGGGPSLGDPVYDNFPAAGGGPLTRPSQVGPTPTADFNGGTDWGVYSGDRTVVIPTQSDGFDFLLWETNSSDSDVVLDMEQPTGAGGGLCLAFQDRNNYIGLYRYFVSPGTNNGVWNLFYVVGGSQTNIIELNPTVHPTDRQTLRVRREGDDIEWFVDGASQGSFNVPGMPTGTKSGLFSGFSSTISDDHYSININNAPVQILFPDQTLEVGSQGNVHGFRIGQYGTLNPAQTLQGDLFARFTVNNSNGQVRIRINNLYPQTVVSTIEIVGVGTLNTADATYSNPGGNSQWVWSSTGFTLADGAVYAINYD